MKTLRHVVALTCAAVALTACAILQPIGKDDDARRAAKITLAAYEATQQAMLIYGRLPDCDAVTMRFCKYKGVWARLKAADLVATTAINEAATVLSSDKIDAGEIVKALIAIDHVKQVLIEAQTKLKEGTT